MGNYKAQLRMQRKNGRRRKENWRAGLTLAMANAITVDIAEAGPQRQALSTSGAPEGKREVADEL